MHITVTGTADNMELSRVRDIHIFHLNTSWIPLLAAPYLISKGIQEGYWDDTYMYVMRVDI